MATVQVRNGVDRAPPDQHFCLSTFGDFALRTPSGVKIPGLGRKASGLIAYLALTRGHATRGALANLLWGDRGADQARASLRQACYELRHALPASDPLLNVGRDDVALELDRLTTDLAALAELGGDPIRLAAALDPAQRLLLRDLDMLSPAFDDWLAVERVRRADERRAVVVGAARCAIAARHWDDARQLAKAYLGVESTDPEAAQIAMRAAAEAGDADDARRVYARHAAALRRELDAAPSGATTALLGELSGSRPGTGAPAIPRRLGDTLRPSALPAVLDHDVPGSVEPLGGRPGSLRRRTLLAGAGAVMGVALLAGAYWQQTAPSTDFRLIRIDPIAASPGDLEGQAISAGLAAAVMRNLTGTETPIEIVDNLSPQAAPPSLILRGNTLNDHGTLRANFELVAGWSGRVMWAGKFIRPAAELNDFEDQIALQIARELHAAYSDGRAPRFDHDPEFARLSLAHFDSLGTNSAEPLRYDALLMRRAPDFARGWAEYATDTAIASFALPPALRASANVRATQYAHRAIALDPHQGLAYAALTLTLASASQWIERDRIALQGIEADPTEPKLHSFRYDALAKVGRLQDALAEAKIAYQNEHFLPGTILKLIEGETNVGDIPQAREYIRIGRKFWPDHPWIEGAAVATEADGGDPMEALRVADKFRANYEHEANRYYRIYLKWRIARTPAAKQAAIGAIKASIRLGGVKGEHIGLLARLGQFDDAFRYGAQLSPDNAPGPDMYGPELMLFRADPRFMTFATRMGFAAIWLQTGKWPDFCNTEKLQYDCKVAAKAATR